MLKNIRKTHQLYLIGLLILASLSTTAFATNTELNDIDGYIYQDAIQDLSEKNIVHGYEDGTYQPNKEINRAEFLKIVLESSLLGENSDLSANDLTDKNCFNDTNDEWYEKYVCYAKKKGIVQGYSETTFKPERSINHVEALKIIYLANNDKGDESATESWFSPYVEDNKNEAINLNLALDHLMTRGEMAKLVSMYMKRKVWKTDDCSEDSCQNTNNNESSNTENNSTTELHEAVDMEECAALSIPANFTTLNPGTDVIYTALQSAKAGDTLVLKGGNYTETHELKVQVENLTIMSYPGEWAVIDRSNDELSDNESGIWFYVGSNGGNLLCTEIKGGLYAVSTETKWDWDEADKSGASNLTIKNNKLHSSGHDVVRIKPNCDNVQIIQNEIYDSGLAYAGQDSCNAEGIDNVNADNMLVQNNYIHDICSTGVYCKGGAMNCLIENNTIENTGEIGISLGFDTSPEYFDMTVNPNMYESIGGIARNNLIVGTNLAGIALYASKDSQIYNNTVSNANQDAIQASLYFGITYQDWEESAKRPANTNPDIHDNIFIQNFKSPIISIRTSEELGGLSALDGALKIDNNCYFDSSQEAQFEDGRTIEDFGGGWTEFWIGNLNEWQSLISGDTNSHVVQPLLNDQYQAQAEECKDLGRQ